MPPAITTTKTLPPTTGSTNPGSRMSRGRKLLFQRTSPTPTTTMTKMKTTYPMPGPKMRRTMRTPHKVGRKPGPSYDTVLKPESLWQLYNMPQYNHEIDTVDQLRQFGTFGMKPPYRFGTHEDDPMKSEYTKLQPSVLTIASSAQAGQRAIHVFLNERHAAVVTKTNATITDLGKTIDIDSWGRTAPSPYEMMRSAPDTSFNERGNAGGKPSYQWYTKIELACQNF